MTLFRVEHPNGLYSERRTHDDLRLNYAVIVYTPAETRLEIVDLEMRYVNLLLDNIDRALADGTVITLDDGTTYVGGIAGDSVERLQVAYTEVAAAKRALEAQDRKRDMFQAVAWFATKETAERLAERLDDKYADMDVFRSVYTVATEEVADDSAGS